VVRIQLIRAWELDYWIFHQDRCHESCTGVSPGSPAQLVAKNYRPAEPAARFTEICLRPSSEGDSLITWTDTTVIFVFYCVCNRELILLLKQKLSLASALFAVSILSPMALYGQNMPLLQVAPVTFGLFHPLDADTFTTINAAFSPDGRTVYYSKSHAGWTGLTIFESHLEGTHWSEPEVAPFSGVFRDTDPVVTPDGKAVFFASMRDAQGDASKTYSLFRVSLDPTDGKSVESLGAAINDGSTALYPSVARDGTLYFMRSMNKTAKIVRSELKNGVYSSTEVLNIPGDSETVFDSDPTIAPDQSFVVFASNRPDSLGGNDLYISFHHGQQWCAPVHLDAPINSPGPEAATGLSPDGRTLYFASSRNTLRQPRAKRASAADFRAEGNIYDNGTVRTYQVDLGPWIDAHRSDATSCDASNPNSPGRAS